MDIFTIIDKIKEFFVFLKNLIVALPWPNILSAVRVVSVFVSIFLFIAIIYLIFVLRIFDRLRRLFGGFVTPKTFPKKKLEKKWERIEKRLKIGQEAELKLAVIEADKIFDDILKRIGYLGKDMGERLRKINSSQMANIDDIWDAHKIRNNIVHDIDHKLSNLDAEKSVEVYRKALEELEAL